VSGFLSLDFNNTLKLSSLVEKLPAFPDNPTPLIWLQLATEVLQNYFICCYHFDTLRVFFYFLFFEKRSTTVRGLLKSLKAMRFASFV
jgi:hypothetical protein